MEKENREEDAEARLQKLERELAAVANEQNGKPIEWTLDMALQAIKNITETARRLMRKNAEAELQIRELKKAARDNERHGNAIYHARNAALEMLRTMAETGDLIKALTGMEAKQVAMGSAFKEAIEKLRDNEIPQWLVEAMLRREEEDAERDEE